MPDDPSKRGPADRIRINVHERWEVDWWTQHLGCTKPQLIDCVNRVGVMVADVKKCLGSKANAQH